MTATERVSCPMAAATCSSVICAACFIWAAGAEAGGSGEVVTTAAAEVIAGGCGKVLVGLGPNISDTRLIGREVLPELLRRL